MKIRSLFCKLSPTVILVLSACGGGGSPSGTTTPVTPVVITKTGVFIDSAVEGLDIYVDGIKTGSSNAKGEFSYPDGKEVTFKVGKITLGSSKTPAVVTPGDLSSSPLAVLSILKFLQSLDQDANPANGISLAAAKVAQIVNTVDLSKADATSLSSALQGITGITVVSDEAALKHFSTAFASGQAISNTVDQAVKGMIGTWHFVCDGAGRSRIGEFAGAGATIWTVKSQARDYANANCTGAYVDQAVQTFAPQSDKFDILGAVVNADSSINLFGAASFINNVTGQPEIKPQSGKLTIGKSFAQDNSRFSQINKISSFSFPAANPSDGGTGSVGTLSVTGGENYPLRVNFFINSTGLLTRANYDFHKLDGSMTACTQSSANEATCHGASSNFGPPATSITLSPSGAASTMLLTTGQDLNGYTFTGNMTGTTWVGTWNKVATSTSTWVASGTFSVLVAISLQ